MMIFRALAVILFRIMLLMKPSIFALSPLVLCICIESWIIRLTCKTEADFSIVIENFKLTNSLITQISTRDHQQCVVECVRHDKCKSFNYKIEGVDENCELNGNIKGNTEEHFKAETGWIYFSTNYNTTKIGTVCESLNPCSSNYCVDSCNNLGYQCFDCDQPNNVISKEPFCKKGMKNLALGKKTSGPDVFKGRLPSLANDGISSSATYAQCFTSEKNLPPWWMVDLGARAVIENVSIWSIHQVFTVDVRAGFDSAKRGENNPACMQNVQLSISERVDINCPTHTFAQYVSVIDNVKENLRICEVEVYGFYVK